MPLDSQWEVQKSLYGVLSDRSSLTTLLGAGGDSLYDYVPSAGIFPYIVFSGMQAQVLGTQAQDALDITVTLDVYSRATGYREIRGIISELVAALHNAADLSVNGQAIILCRIIQTNTQILGDGKTRQGRVVLRVISEASGA